MKNKYFYIGKKEAQQHQSLVYCVSPKPLENYTELLGNNCIEFYGEELPHYPTITSEGSVGIATTEELYASGIYTLQPDEFLHEGKVRSTRDFPIPETILKPRFDLTRAVWVESATQVELDAHDKQRRAEFYRAELVLATRAHAELMLDIITPEQYAEIKSYMQSIYPHSNVSDLQRDKVERPQVFKKYSE